jgi:tetratricopeptide (TPR) repeat protein
LWQDSLEIQERIGDVKSKAMTLNNMANVIQQQGDIDRALQLWQDSLEIYERIGDVQGKAVTLNNIAGVIAQQGDIDRALSLWQDSLEIQERIGDVQGKAATLSNMAGAITYLEKVVSHLEKKRDPKAFSSRKSLDAMRQLYRRYTSQRKGFLKPPSKGTKKRK